jgi:hypothetical protein
MYKIDEFCFEKYFQLFKVFVENESKTSFVSFPSNRFTESNEGYKDEIYEKARNILGFWNWKNEDIGTGKIFQSVLSAIKLSNNENNLVDWRLTVKFENKAKDKGINDYEKCLFDFFTGVETDEESFNIFIEYFGKNYPLLAYLFFIKDKAQYMPISPNNFDIAFDKLGVTGFKLNHQCSWGNYCSYNSLLNQARELLLNKEIKDVSLLNAHSFVWIVSDLEDKLTKLNIPQKDIEQKIRKYKELISKDRETIIKARNGQGIFRSFLIQYWGKCSITGCDDLGVLIASHIKPWNKCDTIEAIDPYNGLLLIPNMDKLFDIGLISFDDNGEILISDKLTTRTMGLLGINKEMKLGKIETEHKPYLAYHRDNIFK